MTEGKKLLLIGGGGHCRSVLDCLLSAGLYQEIGIVDAKPSVNALHVSVVGSDEDLPALMEQGWREAFISVGSVGSSDLRRRLYQKVKALGFSVPTVIDPSAIIARDAVLEEGVFIGKRAVVNIGAHIGTCAILNTGSIIEHDCRVGAFSHVSPGAVLCGQVCIGSDSHVGAGSVVRQCLSVGDKTVIGMGSVVVRDLPDGVTAYGNPCRVVR